MRGWRFEVHGLAIVVGAPALYEHGAFPENGGMFDDEGRTQCAPTGLRAAKVDRVVGGC